MTHVLVFHDVDVWRQMMTEVCTGEGYVVSVASTVGDALTALRSSPHPLVVVAERDHSSVHPDGPFFHIIHDHPEQYGRHLYIALHAWLLSDDEKWLLESMNVLLLTYPFTVNELLALIEKQAARLPWS
jgi:CheY-like chemotaxis protein